MLGVTYTYIQCNKTDCKYHINFNNGMCQPPVNDALDECIKIVDGVCVTYKKIPKKRVAKKKASK